MWTYGKYNRIIQKLVCWVSVLGVCLCVSAVYDCVGTCVGVLLFVSVCICGHDWLGQ